MEIIYLTKYTRLGASSRMRSYQYVDYLREQGIDITVKPFFSDSYLKLLYAKKNVILHVIWAYLNRFITLFTLFKYDRIVIEKELFPYFPPFFEWIFSMLRVKYLVDYDDAIFHNYDQNKNPLIRKFLGNKIDVVMRYSYILIAGNSYLAERARMAGAKNIHIIPTVIDLDRYKLKDYVNNKPFIVGWIGTQSTFEKHFSKIKNLIPIILSKYNVEFHVIGVTKEAEFSNRLKYFSWSEDTEVSYIMNFDVGIMPLENSLWEKGKCAYKLIQYMACGLPVIASPVGMNNQVVIENVNGALASSKEEWISILEKYIINEDLRRTHGLAGFKMVKAGYSLQSTGPQMLNILTEW